MQVYTFRPMRQMIQSLGVVAVSGLLSAQAIQQSAPEQTAEGSRPPARIAAQFDGLGVGFEGPQGTASLRNPSDNSLAVGRDHIVQTVNSRMAIFTKRGARFKETGRALYGPVNTSNVFRNFGGTCEARNNGDAVVRYDQLAHRWLIVSRSSTAPKSVPINLRSGPHARRFTRVQSEGRTSQASPNPCINHRRPIQRRHRPHQPHLPNLPHQPRERMRSATRSARPTIPSARTIDTSSCAPSSPTTRVPRSGMTATTCRAARVTKSSRSTPAWLNARRCSPGVRRANSVSSSTMSTS